MQEAIPSQRLGVVFNFNKKRILSLLLMLWLASRMKRNEAFAGTVEKSRYKSLCKFRQLIGADKITYSVKKIAGIRNPINISATILLFFSGIWENIIHDENDDLPEETRELMAEYLLPKRKIFIESADNPFVFILDQGKEFKTANLEVTIAGRGSSHALSS
ncbi:MAG: hypothetical protein IPI78_12355 [Chitinophagaceae bacterium]|nr:hypothetical protein [Chitinophagaceae bacterium]